MNESSEVSAGPDLQVRRTMRLSLFEGGLTQVFLNWTTGSVLIGYLLHLGASPNHIALVGSVPMLAQIASPFGAYLAEVAGRRRVTAAVLSIIGRLSWIVAAFLPQLPVEGALLPTLLVGLVFFAATFQAATGTIWSAWMGDVVPDDRRGRYFGFRTGLLGFVGTAANLAAGSFLDSVNAPLSFQVALGVAVGLSLLASVLYLFHYDPPTEKSRLNMRQLLTVPLKQPNFRRFLAFAIYWQFAVMLGAPFVLPYWLEELQMSFTQVSYWSAISATTALLTTALWGRLADRVGNRAVLAIGTFFAGALLPANWILAGLTGNLNFIWFAAVCDALAWGAIHPSVFGLVLVSAPKAGRVKFIAMYSLAQGVAGFIGGALSGPLLLYLQGFSYAGNWTGFHSLFAITASLRMLGWLWVRRVEEPRAWRTRDVVRDGATRSLRTVSASLRFLALAGQRRRPARRLPVLPRVRPRLRRAPAD